MQKITFRKLSKADLDKIGNCGRIMTESLIGKNRNARLHSQ